LLTVHVDEKLCSNLSSRSQRENEFAYRTSEDPLYRRIVSGHRPTVPGRISPNDTYDTRFIDRNCYQVCCLGGRGAVFVQEENSTIAIAVAKGLWWSFVDCAAHESSLVFVFGLTMTPYRTMDTTIRVWDTIAKFSVPHMAVSHYRNAERRWIDLFADGAFFSTLETLYTYLDPDQVRYEVTNRKCGELLSSNSKNA
jgi:hypothetical protein